MQAMPTSTSVSTIMVVSEFNEKMYRTCYLLMKLNTRNLGQNDWNHKEKMQNLQVWIALPYFIHTQTFYMYIRCILQFNPSFNIDRVSKCNVWLQLRKWDKSNCCLSLDPILLLNLNLMLVRKMTSIMGHSYKEVVYAN